MLWMEFKNRWNLAENLSDEKKEFVRKNWPGYDRDKEKFDIPYSKVRVTWDEYRLWVEAGFEMEIEACKSMMLTTMKDRDSTGKDEDEHSQFMSGRLFNVTLPDVGLLFIDEVNFIENSCTDELQTLLDKGWRILAVCPPNAQRRPDYILGRRKQP